MVLDLRNKILSSTENEWWTILAQHQNQTCSILTQFLLLLTVSAGVWFISVNPYSLVEIVDSILQPSISSWLNVWSTFITFKPRLNCCSHNGKAIFHLALRDPHPASKPWYLLFRIFGWRGRFMSPLSQKKLGAKIED